MSALDNFVRGLLRPRALIFIALAFGAGLAIWLGVDAWLDGRTSVTFDRFSRPIDFIDPRWFHLVAIIPFFFLLRIVSLTDLSLAQQLVQSGLRSLIIVAAAIALARPSWITHDDRVATVVLVDVSASVSDQQLDASRAYVDQLAKDAARKDGNLQVITFAEKPRVVRADGDGHVDPKQIVRHAGADAGTDIQAAMQLAYGLFPDGYLPHMVVISDGNQTSGDMLIEAYRAKEMQVVVSWKTFDADPVAEIRVIGLSVPDEVKVGQPFEVTAEIWSTHEDHVTLALNQDEFPNPLEPTKSVVLHEGQNRVKFKAQAAHAGASTFRMRLSHFEHDTEKANNQAVITTPVKGKPNVLYVEGGILREPGAAGYLQRALEHESIDVEVRGPRGIPANPAELEKYDLVLVSDVPSMFLGAGQMAALDAYVQKGGGMIMAGGEDSFGSGGYQGTRIEQMLPVRFDSEKTREQPDVAVVLVIDRSGSMQGAKLEAAKESARVTAEVLSPTDVIAVVAFDSEAQVFVRPQRASNRMRISAEISRLQSGGGTNIYPGLKEAFEILQGVNAKVKHVILLTDGEAPYDGIVDLVQDMRSNRITISAVGVQGADQNLLHLISDNGGGTTYLVEDIGALPRIFMKDTSEVQKSQLVEDNIKVRVAKQVEMIEGTSVESAPFLHGYVTTKPKPTAEVVLISDLGEPILARWRHGAGTAVAWTSDVKNRWSADWIRWGGYPRFWAQLVRTSMRRKVYDSYDMFTKVADGRAQVVVDAIDTNDRFVNELDTELEVINPATDKPIIDPATGKPVPAVAMNQTAAGRYTADFRIARYGSFLLKAVHKRGDKVVAESMGSVSLPYPLEYLKTTPDTQPLEQTALVTGGANQATPAQIWDSKGQSIPYTQELWPWVLLGLLGLIVIDLYAKRVRLFGYRTIKFA